MLNYKIILFDLDGTLTDPKIGITKSVQYALRKFGIIIDDPNSLTHFVGPPLNKSFQKYYSFDEEKSMQAVEYYREYFSTKGMFENTVYPGIPELLQKLKENKKLLYVVTSKPTYFSEQIIKHFELDQYFTKVIGPHMDLSNADKPTLVKEALSQHPQENKNSFVMIGDKEHDIIGAKANDVDSIGVTYGYGTKEELEKAKPTTIVNTVDELTTLLVK